MVANPHGVEAFTAAKLGSSEVDKASVLPDEEKDSFESAFDGWSTFELTRRGLSATNRRMLKGDDDDDLDTQLSTTWLKNTEYGCSVWGGSLQEGAITGDVTTACKVNQNLAQAVAICYGAGARLCTVAELEAGCAADTGCSFNKELVWAGVSSPFASPVG